MESEYVLDETALQKGWGAEGQYWFSVKDFSVIDIGDIDCASIPHDVSETQFMLGLGYIPYFRVNRIEMARAFIEAVGSKKLKEKMSVIPDDEYINVFWKYFDAYKHLSDGYEIFQEQFLRKKAIDWCTDNDIRFVVA